MDMSDVEDIEERIPVLTKSLFPRRLGSPDRDASPLDVTGYAVTVNIRPGKLMNKKPWRKYGHDQQRSQLLRIEASFRKNHPSVILKEIQFEECPNLHQIHFHAHYVMPSIFLSTLECYYEKVVSDNNVPTQTEPWRYLKVKEIFDEEGWLQYIRKDLDGSPKTSKGRD